MSLKRSLTYFYSLIDTQGIIQFSHGQEKDYQFGYAIEDQARALIVATQLGDQKLIKQLLKIIERSVDQKVGVKMLWDESGKYETKVDHFGEASAEVLWSLGSLAKAKPKLVSDSLVEYLGQGVAKSKFPRVWGYGLLGLVQLGKTELVRELAAKLESEYQQHHATHWEWFEEEMTYANALLPWGLIEAGVMLNRDDYIQIGQTALDFLVTHLDDHGVVRVVGNKGWWHRGGEMAIYDQQPIDVSYFGLAYLDLYAHWQREEDLVRARWFGSWFEGNNLRQTKMIRPDGGCYDGLNREGANPNSGAESIVVYLMFKLALASYSAI